MVRLFTFLVTLSMSREFFSSPTAKIEDFKVFYASLSNQVPLCDCIWTASNVFLLSSF